MNLISGKENVLTKEAAEVILKDNEDKAQTIKSQHQELIALRATLQDACKKIDAQLAKVIVAQDNQKNNEDFLNQIKSLLQECYVHLKSTQSQQNEYNKVKTERLANSLSHFIDII